MRVSPNVIGYIGRSENYLLQQGYTAMRIFDRAYPGSAFGPSHCLSKENSLVKSLTICTTCADCCVVVVVHRYGDAMFVVQNVLTFGMGVVYGVYLVKRGVYRTIH